MEEQKLSTGAKTGYFFLSLVPFISFWIINIGITIVFLVPHMSEAMEALNNNDDEAYYDIVEEISPPATIIMHILIVLIFGIWYFFGRSKNTEPKFKFSGKILLITFILALSMSFISNTTALIQEYFVPEIVEDYEDIMEMSGFGTSIITSITAMIFAPIGEELLCRGVTLMYARKAFPFWLANIMQALFFGIMHMNWVQGTYAFLIGLILGYSVKKYNSIIPAMIMHFFVNTVASVITALIFGFIPANIPCIIITVIISLMAVIPSFMMMKNDKIS